jgi:autotransporter-associated beta strand protein
VQAGAGTTTLAGTNTYAGATAVNAGILAITNAAGLGSTTGGTAVASGAVLDLQNVAVGAESVTLAAGGTLRSSVGTSSLSGDVTLSGPGNSDFSVGTGAELTVSGVVSGGGALQKVNAGTLVLTGANTYTGLTTVNTIGGTLAVTHDSALGSTSAGTSVRTGGTLELRDVTVADSVTANGGGILVSNGASTISGNLIGFSAMPINVLDGAQLDVTGIATGGVGLVKNGGGTLTLIGDSTSTGSTTVSAGTVRIGDGGTTGTATRGAVTVASGANLVFDRSDSVSLSTLADGAGGITGAGNVTALIGGDFNVDRAIALSGPNSSIVLEAGRNVPAGTVAGGDVTLSSNVSTSATGTLTIFSGNATTAAHEAMVGGASGPTRYKTYGASAADTAGAVGGTRNYYYRQQPSALTASGFTATKEYDGLLDASAVLNSGAVTINGTIDGDTVALSDFTITGASFDTAHAGTRGLDVSFSGTYTGDGNWSIAGGSYTLANYSNATAGTITPKSISASIIPLGRTYDGLTGTSSTLSAPTGFVGNDNAASVSGLMLSFDDPNAGTRNISATGTGTLSGFTGAANGNGSGIGTGNEVAGIAGDYVVAIPSPVSAVIAQAPLTVTANDDVKVLTQADAAGYNGASYSGFVNGESSANLAGSLSITRSNAGTEAAATYSGVLVPTGQTSGNYTITYVNGNYQILPAQQLLVSLQNVSNSYGTASNYVVTSAEYLDANGTTLRTLTQTAQSGNTYTFADGLGGSVTFTVAPTGAVISGAGHLAAGSYTLSGVNTNVTGNNFLGSNYLGNQTVTQVGVGANVSGGVSRVYDGTTAMTGLTMVLNGQLVGDHLLVNGSGMFSSRNAGSNLSYDISNITLSGMDAGNYYVLGGGSFSGSNGTITPRDITIGGLLAQNRAYDGTTAATLTTAGATLNGLVTGDAATLDATSVSALFADKHVGIGKDVAVGGLALSGADAGNYNLIQPTGLAANITPALLTVTAVTNTKPYDGTTGATATPQVTSGGLMSGDRFTTFIERYGSEAIGLGLTLDPLVAIDDGNGGANYAVTLVSDTTGRIVPGTDLSRLADANTATRLDTGLAKAHGGNREIDDERSRPSVKVIATGLKLPEGMTGAFEDFGGFED